MESDMRNRIIRVTQNGIRSEFLAKSISEFLCSDLVFSDKFVYRNAAAGYIVKFTARLRARKGAASMNIHFTLHTAGRKAFAYAVGEILGKDVIYNGVPTFSYTIGNYTVDRSGALICPNNIFHAESVDLIMALRKRGYNVQTDELPDFPALQTVAEPMDVQDHVGRDRLTIAVPLDGFTDKAIENLGEIVAGKNRLFKKAFGTDSLRIDTSNEELRFPWFALSGADGETDAYSRFIHALCEMAKKQKRVTAKDRESESDKFAMRVFLIRLGFVGEEYKQARKILLRNLTGNSSYAKPKQPPENSSDETSSS